jgi:hypothetical protein
MAKQYRSEAAHKMAEKRKGKPVSRDSKKLKGKSDKHNGGSLGQSGLSGKR